MNKKSALQLSVSFIVIIIICLVVFISSIYIVRRFFTHAEDIKRIYDERAEKEIERLLDDGSRVAIPFDRKTIVNGDFNTFGIGVLNMLGTGPSNKFMINISFNKAYDRLDSLICQSSDPNTDSCGNPETWLQTTAGIGDESGIIKMIRNNEQEKFLLGIGVKNAPAGTYIFDVVVRYYNGTDWVQYDTLHKIYVEVP
ncbi:hypothetical protein KY366_04585 [Candidatus Woesearchaeota archaeon]|nr:hypothetical protein [Candidatus Woesearchaeota archaeon]